MSKPETISPWSIKGVPKEIRELASKKATAADMFLGEWLSEAVRRYAEADILPPSQAPAPRQDIPPALPAEAVLATDIGGLAAALSAVAQVQADAGKKPPVALANAVRKAATSYAKAAAGGGSAARHTGAGKRHTGLIEGGKA